MVIVCSYQQKRLMRFEYPKIIKKNIIKDSRGSLLEVFHANKFKEKFPFALFVFSKKNVFRGLHFQKKKQQSKLVIIISGAITDYCVDLRRNSPTYLKTFKFKLKENSVLYIPKGFAHGYLTLKKNTRIIYLLSNYRSKSNESGVAYNDKLIKLNLKKNIIISAKDKKNISISSFEKKIKSL